MRAARRQAEPPGRSILNRMLNGYGPFGSAECRYILLDNSVYGLLPKYENALTVILNLIQNLIRIMRYETLKQYPGSFRDTWFRDDNLWFRQQSVYRYDIT